MKYIYLFLVIFTSITAQIKFDDYFIDKTLRIDILLTGDKNNVEVSLYDVLQEPYWGGSKTVLIDELVYGNYFFKVYDIKSGSVIYSRGFNHLFQEWQSTEEAKTTKRSFDATITLPYPKDSIKVELQSRDRRNNFTTIFEYTVDPNDYMIKKQQREMYDTFSVHSSGASSHCLDIVLIPEGYTEDEMDLFKEDCDSLAKYLFEYSPFDEFIENINIWGVEAPSEESGTDIPGQNIWKKTILNSNFWTFRSERYLMTYDYFKARDLAANVPYDQIYIIVNTDKYGGGAIYNYYSLTAAHHPVTKQIFVHEFGHGLAGLADEYGNDPTYQDYYPKDVEPWEPNITTLVDFKSKWKDLVSSGTPIPTPSEEKYYGVIGAFEGAGYADNGVYRSTYNSIMRSFASNEFNEVCKKVLRKVIGLYIK